MNSRTGRFFGSLSEESSWKFILLISLSSAFSIILSAYCLSKGITILFPHTYYIPIALSAYYFKKNGLYLDIALCIVYLGLSFYFVSGSPLLDAFLRSIVFLIVGLIIAVLASKLDLEKKRYKDIFDMTTSGLATVKRNDGKIAEANPKFHSIIGDQSPDISLFSMLSAESKAALEPIVARGDPIDQAEVKVELADGTERILIISGIPKNGTEYLFSCTDITDRIKAENSLQETRDKIGMFCSITRHDISNQMMAISGYLGLAKRREKDPEMQTYFSNMSTATKNIQVQMEFMKAYQNFGHSRPVWMSVSQSIERSMSLFRVSGVTLQDDVEGMEILVDPLAEKAFYNFIDNSLRHGKNVNIIRVTGTINDNALTVVYEDNGIGIRDEDKKRLFMKGFGTDAESGLALIKDILGLTGITIRETGVYGKGARFELTVPNGAWRENGATANSETVAPQVEI